jgi:N-methylhydantoinase B
MELKLFELEIFNNLLGTIAEEMGSVLVRAGFSPNIKERRDLSCAIFNSEGDMIAQAAHIPIHLGSMSFAARSVATENLSPGDVFILNDPFRGGTHLPDVTCVAPVFVDGKPEFLLASRAHHADIGGATPGSLPLSTTIHEEGIIIPPTRIREEGVLKETLLQEIIRSTRDHEEREGDLRAQIASLDTGEKRMRELLEKHSLEKINLAASGLLDYGERLVRSAIEKIPDGSYVFTDYLEDDGAGTRDIPIKVKVKINGNSATVDFRGSSKKVRGCLNAPLSVTTSAVLYCFQCLSGEDTPLNSGTLRPIEIKVDRDSVLNARFPSAVVGGNVETSQRVVDVVFGALAQAVPETIQAASAGTMSNLAFGSPGNTPADSSYAYYETIAGGMGGRSNADGANAVHTHMTNTLNTPVEAIERELPVMVESYSVRKGSGGAGRFPGGDGITRQYRFLEDSHVSLITERRERSPWGARGGEDGTSGENSLVSGGEEKKLPAKCSISVKAGEAVRIETPGGGGWGTPAPATFFTIDAHQDIAFHLRHYKRDFENPEGPCMITLPGLRQSGARVVFNTIFIHPKHKPEGSVAEAMAQLDVYDDIYREHSEDVFQIRTRQDIDTLSEGEKIGFFTLMEGADPVSNPEHLIEYQKRGVRAVGLSWNNRNIYASGPESKRGLSPQGKELLHRMNALGITLDLSHLNEKCFWESVELTELIPVATHSNSRALVDHPRNLRDEQLRAISERGGVIGVVFYGKFLRQGEGLATLEDIYAHIDHIISVCGEDHVGVGTDMDGAPIKDFPEEMRHISELPALPEYLLGKGYPRGVVEKIMGMNFLRVIRTNLEKTPDDTE